LSSVGLWRVTENFMKKLLGILALSLGLFAGQAHADVAKMYYGLGFADGKLEMPNADKESLGTVNATLGFQLADFIGIEVSAGALSDQTSSIVSEPVVQYQAAMVRLGYRFDRAGFYIMGGQARIDVDYNGADGTAEGVNVVGGGINLFGSETTSLNLQFLSFDDGELTTASIGFQYYFGGFR